MFFLTRQNRWVATSLTVALLGSLITGCSSGAGPSVSKGKDDNSKAAATAGDTIKDNAADNLKGEFTLWSWDADRPKLMEAFHQKYPNIKMKVVNVQASDVPKKLQAAIASGGELPDLIRIERGQRPALLEMDVLEDLSKSSYNVDTVLLFDYDIKVNQNSKGELISVPEDMSVGGLAYVKDLTKMYLGTDDPKQLEATLTSWDTFIQKTKEAVDKSGGKIKAFPSLGDALTIINGQRKGPYFDGDKLNTNILNDVLQLLVKFRDSGTVDKLDQWTPAWNASFGIDKYMFFPCPVWMPQYVIGPNDKTGKARYGLMVAPEGGYIFGGSGFGIPKNAKHKELAFKWLQFEALSQEGAEAMKKDGVFTHYKKAYDNPSFTEWKWPQNFGDQNIGEKFFKDISSTTKDMPENTNNALLSDAMGIVVKTMVQDPSFTADKAMDKIKKEIKAKNQKITF